jgi:hypothetical protein
VLEVLGFKHTVESSSSFFSSSAGRYGYTVVVMIIVVAGKCGVVWSLTDDRRILPGGVNFQAPNLEKLNRIS